MIELDSRVWRSGKLSQLAGVIWADCSGNLTQSCGHVVLQESMECCLSAVTKSTVKQVHGQRVTEDFSLATRGHADRKGQDSAVQSHAIGKSLHQKRHLLQDSTRELLLENYFARNLLEDIEEICCSKLLEG